MFLERWNIKPKERRCFPRYETYFPYQIGQNVQNWNSKLIKKNEEMESIQGFVYIILSEMCCVSVYRINIP